MSRRMMAGAVAGLVALAGCSGGSGGGRVRVTYSGSASTASTSTASASTASASSTPETTTSASSTSAGATEGGDEAPDTREAIPGPEVEVAALSKAPTIDGDQREWEKVPAYSVQTQVGGKGSTKAISSWRLGWDENALYLFARAADPALTQTHVQRPWLIGTGDAIGLEIGTFRDRVSTTKLDAKDTRILIAPNETGGTLRAIAKAGGDDFDQGTTWTSGSAVAKRTASGWVVEAAIPWSDLGQKPKAGLTLAGQLLQADAVASGAKRGSLAALLSNNPQRRGSGLKWRFAWGQLTLQK